MPDISGSNQSCLLRRVPLSVSLVNRLPERRYHSFFVPFRVFRGQSWLLGGQLGIAPSTPFGYGETWLPCAEEQRIFLASR